LTKGELILTIITILGSLTLGLWTTIHLTKKAKKKWSKIFVATVLLAMTLVTTAGLFATALLLRDRMLFIAPAIDCNDKIEIYVAEFWKAGQSYSLNIENTEFEISETYLFDREIYDRKLRGEYCCKLDSCKVIFKLDDQDTTFFISPRKTRRLTVGSFVDKKFLVGTDEDKRFWIIM
jgi:hypothetical protein